MSALDDYLSAQIVEYDEGDFERGLKNYVPQIKGMLGAGQAVIGEGLRRTFGEGNFNSAMIESGLNRMEEAKAAQIHKESDSFSKAYDKGLGTVITDWLPYQAGNVFGNLGEMVVASGFGALMGGGVVSVPSAIAGAFAKDRIKKELTKEALKIAMRRGVIGGQIASSLKSGFGEVGGRAIDEQGLENIDMSAVVPASLGHAGLEFVGDRVMAGALKGVGNKAASVADNGFKMALAKNVGRGATTAAVKEAPTEIGQTILERGAAGLDLNSDEAIREYIDAGMAGAASRGGIPGAAGGVKDTLMSFTSKENIGNKIFKGGQDKARREFSAIDEINRMEAERQNISPEELILRRAALSGQNVTAESLMADDQERTVAASSLATKIVNDPASPESLRKSAADFITRAQNDSQAYVDFTNALSAERDKQGALGAINELLDSVGITLPPERRKKNSAMTPYETDAPDDGFGNRAQMLKVSEPNDILAPNAKPARNRTVDTGIVPPVVTPSQMATRGSLEHRRSLAQLWLKKYGVMTDAFSKLDLDDPKAVAAVEGVFYWVKHGMPMLEEAAPKVVRAFGRDAAKHLQTIYDYSVAEGLAERSSAKLVASAIAKVQQLVARGAGRLDKLGNMIIPSMQDQLTTRDVKSIDTALNKFAEDGNLSAKEIKEFRERMTKYFGGNVDEVLDLYDREVTEDLFDQGNDDDRDEDGNIEHEVGDFDGHLRKREADVVYHGGGFDMADPANRSKLENKKAEVGGFEIGIWDKLKRELEDSPEALRVKEDELIEKYGTTEFFQSLSKKRIEEGKRGFRVSEVPALAREQKLREINKRIRFVGEFTNWDKDQTEFNKRDVKDAEDRTKQGKKTDPKYQTIKDGRLVLERIVDDRDNVTGTDPETGELTFGKKNEEFIVKLSKLVTRIREARGSGDISDTKDIDLANTWDQLMTGLSSMLNTNEFTGRIGYRTEANGPVNWLKPWSPNNEEINKIAAGKKVSVKARVAETGQVITLKDQDAAETIKYLRNDIDALESLKLCMGAV